MNLPTHPNSTRWLGQPPGLFILSLTETWSTFSNYGMRALLVYYMTKKLLISQEHASLIYGGYFAANYFTAIFGGIASDRLITKRAAVILGGSLMALGHFTIAFESMFAFSLATIAFGNGFFLPALSSQIKTLYAADDLRLPSAYNIYYLGINLGACIAPIACGTLAEAYGWNWGFAISSIGMLFGLAIYVFGHLYLPESTAAIRHVDNGRDIPPRFEWRRFGILFCLMAIVVIFRGAYEQQGNTIALWADSGIDRTLTSGWVVPRTWFQSLNPLGVILFTPFLVWFWQWMAKRGHEPSSLQKMILGALIVGISYFMIALVAHNASLSHMRVNGLWLVAFMVVMTLGELFILPVGLGFFGRFAPTGYEATVIALWYFAGFIGNLLAGGLGILWSLLSPGQFFSLIGGVAFVAAALLFPVMAEGNRIERRKWA